MIKIYRYILGYLKVSFYGDFPEKILNICAENGIILWKTKSEIDGIVAFVSIKDFLKFPELVRKKDIRIHIENKYGLPFIVSKYKKRSGLIVGLTIMMCFLNIMSGFIWVIDIEGNHKVKDEEIIDGLKKIGIYEGVYSDNLIPKNDSQRLLLEMENLSWVSLNIEGAHLTVNVSETMQKKEDNIKPCNLKASYDGIIKKIDLKSGNCVVKVGDTVKKGDVLVSGIIETAGGTRFVRSVGQVEAEVIHNFTISKDYKTEVITETGKTSKKKVLEIFNVKIPLFLGGQTKDYREKTTVKNLKCFGVDLPIRLYTKEFKYIKKVNITKSKEELYDELEKDMIKLLEEKKYKEYSLKSKEFTETDKAISLRYKVSLQENIAQTDFLLISTRN